MRSRYSAFVLANGSYLRATSLAQMGNDVERWAKSVVWLGLAVARAEGAMVEFTARCLEGGAVRVMHEVSQFVQSDGRWFYASGENDVTHEKLERNAPCPCGSGRKLKHCHA